MPPCACPQVGVPVKRVCNHPGTGLLAAACGDHVVRMYDIEVCLFDCYLIWVFLAFGWVAAASGEAGAQLVAWAFPLAQHQAALLPRCTHALHSRAPLCTAPRGCR